MSVTNESLIPAYSPLGNDALGYLLAKRMVGQRGVRLLVTKDSSSAQHIAQTTAFFSDADAQILHLPDWETLPYDLFSPLPEIVSERLTTLSQLPSLKHGLLIVPVMTLLQRLAPTEFVAQQVLLLETGQDIDPLALRRQLETAGYQTVSQVMQHGEVAARGSLIDIFPMGAAAPIRIDLFDTEIDSLRYFDPETQRSGETIAKVELLPAREFPTDQDAISRFRAKHRELIEGDPNRSLVYGEVSDGRFPGGIEYYLPLFFEHTSALLDYLPDDTEVMLSEPLKKLLDGAWQAISERYTERAIDAERPILKPDLLYLTGGELEASLTGHAQIETANMLRDAALRGLPPIQMHAHAQRPAGHLQDFIDSHQGNIVFTAESPGRRENLLDILHGLNIRPRVHDDWAAALKQSPALTISPLEHGFVDQDSNTALIPEARILGERPKQRERRRKGPDADQVIRNLTELSIGSPVVHEEQGVGRYLGLNKIDVGGVETEFLTLEYAKGDKLYVPVSNLHLISRYSGTAPEDAPIHRLGGEQWQKLRKKAAEKARDVAAELLHIHAKRAAKKGHSFPEPGDDYTAFSAGFPFEETPDQKSAIEAVIDDLCTEITMDRVVCGDVGFGKTEVAMRAAFVAASSGKQVAILAPTTLLAQQHYQNFRDRFADWPITIEAISRLRTKAQQNKALDGIAAGTVDILIGTHKLLQPDIKFKDLGLVIIDEEQRFGVRHKEQFKKLRAAVDMLTLTATPIPRTLNMAMSGLRDLSIIATPPARRHPIKTFISKWNEGVVREAVLREINRGGQVYFLHNEVKTIEKTVETLKELIPEARVQHAHGQMRERELEQVMLDFYHQRFNVLVSTTIIESGIDVSSANTIIMNRADRLGLAQMHQLRGRVGRSHHRAYAYLLTPEEGKITADAKKRLEAIEHTEDLGAGFMIATHDLEIRGAGELLGEGQSGQIQEVGFTLYTELLERAVAALKAGREPDVDAPFDHGPEIDLALPALLPDDYVPDVHTRLVMYKRIASAEDETALRDLQVEMIDRFGLLPDQAKSLFRLTEMKLSAGALGIKKIKAGETGGIVEFKADTKVDPTKIIQMIQSHPNTFKLLGSDRLRFTQRSDTVEKRFKNIETLLGELAA